MARGFGQNGDSDADADSDFLAWQRELGQSANVTTSAAAIPEPSTELLLFLAFLSTTFRSTAAKCVLDRTEYPDASPIGDALWIRISWVKCPLWQNDSITRSTKARK
jgi:hypothetical protein